jgi:Haem-degrading
MNEYKAMLEELRQQEEEIQFASFTNETALTLGLARLQEANKRSKPVAIDITRSGQQLFHFVMAGLPSTMVSGSSARTGWSTASGTVRTTWGSPYRTRGRRWKRSICSHPVSMQRMGARFHS